MQREHRIRLLWPSLIIFSLLSACAQPANVPSMIVPPREELPKPKNSALEKAVCVELVEGGKLTNPLWVSEVDNQGFLKALQGSLKTHDLLAETPGACRFGIEAHLLGLSQPFNGFDLAVTANVNYRVRKAGDEEPYLLKTTRSSYTALFTAKKILWSSRLKEANEGALRKNIRLFIDAIMMHRPKT